VEDAGNERWGCMDEAEVLFLEVEVGRAKVAGGVIGVGRRNAPEDIVIVGKVGEEDAKEEADRWMETSVRVCALSD
jgi:hypothetical protein